MTRREPSPLAKGAAASVSALVFVSLIVHAQWGCGSEAEELAPTKAPVAAEATKSDAAPARAARPAAQAPGDAASAPAPSSATSPQAVPQSAAPSAPGEAPAGSDAAPEPRPEPRGLHDRKNAANRPYLSSSKSDPDMWSRDWQDGVGGLGLVGSAAPGDADPDDAPNRAPTESP